MTDYPYSQQLHDKILADWLDLDPKTFSFRQEGCELFLSNDQVPYKLKSTIYHGGTLYPDIGDYFKTLSDKHAKSIYDEIYINKYMGEIAKENNRKQETAIKNFLNL